MAIKSPGKEQAAPVSADAPAPEDLRIAYQVHTLAQMLYGHLATAQALPAPMSGAGASKEEPMFWSDPNLYGATLPYRDPNIPVQTPFMGPVTPQWQNIPRFLPPPIYGMHPFFNVHPLNVNPYMQPWIDPLQRRFDVPFMQTWIDPLQRRFDVPFMQNPVDPIQRRFDVPYMRPFDLPMYNLYNPYRPFMF